MRDLHGVLKLLFKLRNAAVLQLGHAGEIVAAMCRLEFQTRALKFFLYVVRALHRSFFSDPDFFEIRKFPLQHVELRLNVCKAFSRCVVGLFFQGLAFDLELNDASLKPIHLFGLRIDLDTNARRGLINQIDGLVRQLAITDVAMRQRRRSDDGGIGNFDSVVKLVAFFEATQNRDRVRDGRLFNQNLLEPPLQCGIFLQVLTILIESRRPNAVQVAASQCWFEHVARVHRTLSFAGTNHRMQLVDKENDPAFLLRQVIEHGFEPFFEFAAKLGAGN